VTAAFTVQIDAQRMFISGEINLCTRGFTDYLTLIMWYTGWGQVSFSLLEHSLHRADKAIGTEWDDVVQINTQQSNLSKGTLGADTSV